MSRIPKKEAITITNKAAIRIKELIRLRNTNFVRLGVKKRGCNGFTYVLNYCNKPNRFDEIVEQNGVRLLIDPSTLFSVIGTVIDFKTDRIRSEFVFDNPNSKGSCGCGESFNI